MKLITSHKIHKIPLLTKKKKNYNNINDESVKHVKYIYRPKEKKENDINDDALRDTRFLYETKEEPERASNKTQGKWKIQLTVAIKIFSSKCSLEICIMRSKNNNTEVMT